MLVKIIIIKNKTTTTKIIKKIKTKTNIQLSKFINYLNYFFSLKKNLKLNEIVIKKFPKFLFKKFFPQKTKFIFKFCLFTNCN